MKISPNRIKKLPKVGSKYPQILNRHITNCKTPFKFCQSGDFSPNLVTLVDGPPKWSSGGSQAYN